MSMQMHYTSLSGHLVALADRTWPETTRDCLEAGVFFLYSIYSDPGMDFFETTTYAFIVRIWLEETTLVSGHAKWRGHITHVPSGNRQYFESLDEINTFIRPYLEGIGVKSGISWKIRRWVQRIKAVLFSNI